jgi:hypothetical protein
MADKPAPSDSYVRRFALVTPRTKLFCQLLAALELVQVICGEIAVELDKLGYRNERGAVFSPTSIASMLA